ncbi:MAG: hypothetical protein Q8M01_15795 [Rubrivivax sp.]|nr:hypothetical protein [Rubrivivax sp.]
MTYADHRGEIAPVEQRPQTAPPVLAAPKLAALLGQLVAGSAGRDSEIIFSRWAGVVAAEDLLNRARASFAAGDDWRATRDIRDALEQAGQAAHAGSRAVEFGAYSMLDVLADMVGIVARHVDTAGILRWHEGNAIRESQVLLSMVRRRRAEKLAQLERARAAKAEKRRRVEARESRAEG